MILLQLMLQLEKFARKPRKASSTDWSFDEARKPVSPDSLDLIKDQDMLE